MKEPKTIDYKATNSIQHSSNKVRLLLVGGGDLDSNPLCAALEKRGIEVECVAAQEDILELLKKHNNQIDRDLVTVVLHPGMNKLLLKVTNTDLEWGYYLRITDLEGNGIPDIKFHSAAEIKQSLASW